MEIAIIWCLGSQVDSAWVAVMSQYLGYAFVQKGSHLHIGLLSTVIREACPMFSLNVSCTQISVRGYAPRLVFYILVTMQFWLYLLLIF